MVYFKYKFKKGYRVFKWGLFPVNKKYYASKELAIKTIKRLRGEKY